MLSLLLFFYVSSTLLCEGRQEKTALCTLPPHPKNGHYVVLEPKIPNLAPGDKLHNFTVEVKCDPGYQSTDDISFTCSENGASFDKIAECLPQCWREENVLTCGDIDLGNNTMRVRCIDPEPQLEDIKAFTSLLAASSPCGHLLGKSQSSGFGISIVGGRDAVRDELPWHAGIYKKSTKPYMQICGGSLVSKTVVISAAHCFWSDLQKKLPASNYAVAVGKLLRPWNSPRDEDHAQKSDVAEIKIPPRYQGAETNNQDDIALVIVSSPFQYVYGVRPVCLDFDVETNNKQLAAGNEGKVGGWGLTGEEGPASRVLQVVEMPVVAIEQCINTTDRLFKASITSDKICAGYQNGTSVCRGDSGGGLSFINTISGMQRYYLRGVVSGAPTSDHACNTMAWATFTHINNHQLFIRETMQETSSRAETLAAQAPVPQTPISTSDKPSTPSIVPETSSRAETLAAQAPILQTPHSTLDMPSTHNVPETSSGSDTLASQAPVLQTSFTTLDMPSTPNVVPEAPSQVETLAAQAPVLQTTISSLDIPSIFKDSDIELEIDVVWF